MSRPEHVQRCKGWLQEQLAELSGLRSAHPRDGSFKQWRQNTLTVLQRIWPNEPMRSERFRRIPFSPPQGKVEKRAARDWFERGCTETGKYLRSLLENIDQEGVPEAHVAMREAAPDAATARDDDFPVLELPTGNVGPDTGSSALRDRGEIVLDLGASPTGAVPGSGQIPVADANVPAPPQLKVEMTTPAELPAPPVKRPARESGVVHVDGPQRPKAARGSRSKRGQLKSRLKDMLGLGEIESAQKASAPASAPPIPVAPVTPPEPLKSEPQPFREGSVVTSEPRPLKQRPERESMESLFGPEFRQAPSPAPVPNDPVPSPVASLEPPPVRPVIELRPVAPVIEPPPAPPVSGPHASVVVRGAPTPPEAEEEELDPEEFSRAAKDFMMTSPVLGLQGRPVVRQSDATAFTDPDAIAIGTLATDVARLGVPEGLRASARAQLLDLARRLEAGEATWAMLRDAVTFSMDFPDLARRLLPILLPWLDRAA